jgi:hypothetical protein
MEASCYILCFARRQHAMEYERFQAIDECIRNSAHQAAVTEGLSATTIEHFLRTGKETWEGTGSGLFSLAQFKEDAAYTRATKFALRTLLQLLANLLPAEARLAPSVPLGTIQQRIEPMITGLVQDDWREVALREITKRTFVLNFQGTLAAVEAELSTCFMGSAWRILWALFEDYGMKPNDIDVGCDGLAGDYAHVRWSAYQTNDPYSDVVVHEAAHLLHYLKPSHYGLQVRRHQERFIDVEFHYRELFAYACEAYSRVMLHRDRKSRIAFAERIQENAFSFPQDEIAEVAKLVLDAVRVRNGWRVIRNATVMHTTRKRAKSVSCGRSVSARKQTGFKKTNTHPPSYST